MKKQPKFLMMVGIFAVVCLGLFFLELQTHFLRRAFDNIVMDNENHYLPCGKLPADANVRMIVQEHPETLQAIEQVDPGLIGIEIDSSTCPGKADLLIWYPSHQDRIAIKTIIGGDTFFGVPYRLQNR